MKKLPILLCLCLAIFALSACDEKQQLYWPKTTFDGPFPKRNIDLTGILGEQLTLKRETDTVSLKIAGFRNYNLITEAATGDTIFCGPVSRFRGLYYFSHPLNDTAYWISAVSLKGNLVYGLQSAFEQTTRIDQAIEAGQYPKLVKFRTPDAIRLHPNKREMKALFAGIITGIAPDTIISFPKAARAIKEPATENETRNRKETGLISSLYPNPASDFLQVEMQQPEPVSYQLSDLSGKVVLQGKFSSSMNQLDLRLQPAGIYLLTAVDPETGRKETVKILKQNLR